MSKKISGLKSSDFRPLRINMQLFPLFFEFLLWFIYALNYILKGDFDNVFLSIISFIKIFVAEKVAKFDVTTICGKSRKSGTARVWRGYIPLCGGVQGGV